MIIPHRDNCGQNNEQSECLLRPQLFIPAVVERDVNITGIGVVDGDRLLL